MQDSKFHQTWSFGFLSLDGQFYVRNSHHTSLGPQRVKSLHTFQSWYQKNTFMRQACVATLASWIRFSSLTKQKRTGFRREREIKLCFSTMTRKEEKCVGQSMIFSHWIDWGSLNWKGLLSFIGMASYEIAWVTSELWFHDFSLFVRV